MNLVTSIYEAENLKRHITAKYQDEIAAIERTIKQLKQYNTVCTKCNGSGTIYKPRTCAEDDDKYMIKCPQCKGSGLSK